MSEQDEAASPEAAPEESPASPEAAEDAPASPEAGGDEEPKEEGAEEPKEEGAEEPKEEEPKEEEPPPPKEEPKKLLKEVTLEEVEKLARDLLDKDDEEVKGKIAHPDKWADLMKAGAAVKLDTLSADAMNRVLDCTPPVDAVSFGMTLRKNFAAYGKPRMRKEMMRWNNSKAFFEWEQTIGGPLWNFSDEKSKEKLDEAAEAVVKTEYVKQSKEGRIELSHKVEITTPKRKTNKGTYAAIVKRALGMRLEQQGLNPGKYEVEMTGDYKDGDESAPCEFTVTHSVLEEKAKILDRAVKAMENQLELNSLKKELAAAKSDVASAMHRSHSIEQRAGALQEDLCKIDRDGVLLKPLQELRDKVQEPMNLIRDALAELEKESSDETFAKNVAGEEWGSGAAEGTDEAEVKDMRKDYRVNVAGQLRCWLVAQTAAVVEQVENVNDELLKASLEASNCSAKTTAIPMFLDGDAAVPTFLKEGDGASIVLHKVFENEIKKSFDDCAETNKVVADETILWEVTLKMDIGDE